MKLEICIGLTPVQSLSEKLVGLSQELAQQSDAGDVVLQLQQGDRRLTVAPHLTLYQGQLVFFSFHEDGRVQDGFDCTGMFTRADYRCTQ